MQDAGGRAKSKLLMNFLRQGEVKGKPIRTALFVPSAGNRGMHIYSASELIVKVKRATGPRITIIHDLGFFFPGKNISLDAIFKHFIKHSQRSQECLNNRKEEKKTKCCTPLNFRGL